MVIYLSYWLVIQVGAGQKEVDFPLTFPQKSPNEAGGIYHFSPTRTCWTLGDSMGQLVSPCVFGSVR